MNYDSVKILRIYQIRRNSRQLNPLGFIIHTAEMPRILLYFFFLLYAINNSQINHPTSLKPSDNFALQKINV